MSSAELRDGCNVRIEHVNALCVIIETVKELTAETDETSGNELYAIIQQSNDLCHSYASGCADLLSLTNENLVIRIETGIVVRIVNRIVTRLVNRTELKSVLKPESSSESSIESSSESSIEPNCIQYSNLY